MKAHDFFCRPRSQSLDAVLVVLLTATLVNITLPEKPRMMPNPHNVATLTTLPGPASHRAISPPSLMDDGRTE